VSFAAALACGLYLALDTYEVDLGVYLRLGGRYVFTSHLYSLGLGNTGLLFTYPPFAALLFAPWERAVRTVDVMQIGWTLINLAALVGVLVLSIRVARPSLRRQSTWRLALAATLPALLLNPVFLTVGFGQVNLLITLLVMWDLLSARRLGPWQAPQGIATGLAAAIKITPAIFIVYLAVTRRFRAAAVALGTFVLCEFVSFLVSPASSRVYWTKALFEPDRTTSVSTPGLSFISNQSLWSMVERSHHAPVPSALMVPLVVAFAVGGLWLAATAHRRSSPMLGVLICAATALVVSPVTWDHHMVWVVPAIVWLALAEDRPRYGRILAAAAAVLFWCAPIWGVPHGGLLELHLNAWQLVAGDSFFLAVLAFLVGTGVLVVRRRRRRHDGGDHSLSSTRRTIGTKVSSGSLR
jgi:alpha-1,2-mannosyltransferase